MKKNIYFMMFPVIIVVLMIVIFIFDKRTKKVEETSASATVESVVETTATVTPEMMLADFDTYGLQEDAVLEVSEIIREYQNVKLNADSAKMLELYGKTVEDESLTAGLENDKRLYQHFEDTKTYVTKGVIENSYLVFVTSKIKFHFVETLAPSLTWTYVQKTDDGKMILKDPYNLTTEETAFVNKVAASEVVRAMSDQAKKELAAAVISDAQLANVYKRLSGSSVTSVDIPLESSETVVDPETESEAQISIIGETNSETDVIETLPETSENMDESSLINELESSLGAAESESETIETTTVEVETEGTPN